MNKATRTWSAPGLLWPLGFSFPPYLYAHTSETAEKPASKSYLYQPCSWRADSLICPTASLPTALANHQMLPPTPLIPSHTTERRSQGGRQSGTTWLYQNPGTVLNHQLEFCDDSSSHLLEAITGPLICKYSKSLPDRRFRLDWSESAWTFSYQQREVTLQHRSSQKWTSQGIASCSTTPQSIKWLLCSVTHIRAVYASGFVFAVVFPSISFP